MCLRVQLVSAEPQLLQALRLLIERHADLVVVGEASGAAEARAGWAARPDVVVIDADHGDGYDIAAAAKAQRPRRRVLMLSGRPTREAAAAALSAGAAGFVSKLQPPRELAGAIRAVGGGGSYLCPAVVAIDPVRDVARQRLDARELLVYELLLAGRPLDLVARELDVSARTAAAIRARIVRKLELRSSADLARFAVARGPAA
ncbi:MAG TPA: response regulator [Polyangia bacterium]